MKLLSTCLFLLLSSHLYADAIHDLRNMHLLLTSKPITIRHPHYQEWLNKVEEGKHKEVALEITQDKDFLNVVTLAFGIHYLTAGKETDMQLNDALSLIIGITRDNKDARDLLRANYSYGPTRRMGFGVPSPRSNQGYVQLEKKTADFVRFIEFFSPQFQEGDFTDTAGLLTTRWWGERYYEGGTNRRSVVGLMNTFMCTPIDSWKTSGLSTRFIRRDVPRDPSGDPRIFQTECRSCHGAMDAMAGAFAHMNFENNTIVQTKEVQRKYSNLAEVYPEGYETMDNYWKNLLIVRKDLGIEWSKKTQGRGIKELGEMIITSETFVTCLAKRATSFFCHKALSLTDSWIKELARDFSTRDEYKLKELFINIITHKKCL